MVSYGSREERLADTVNQRGVSWRKRVFTIITGEEEGEGGSRRVIYRYILSSWSRKSIRFPPFQVRREGDRWDERWGGYIYVLYVYRSGSITDTREILTQDGIPPPINFALMNGNGINKWLERVSVRFSIRFSWNGNFRFRATLLKTLLKGKYRDGRILR